MEAGRGSVLAQPPWNTYFQRIVADVSTRCMAPGPSVTAHPCLTDRLAELKLAALNHSYLVFNMVYSSGYFKRRDVISKSA